MNLVPLYEEAIQFNNFNGTVLAAGKVEVWYLGRTRKADIYADVAGETPLPNPFNLNDLGMQEVYVNPAFNYTLVVCDPYGAELFSVDKYLQGAGGHTTSNVVVQPSEHIGVSAWTVGEVQIYQPYLVGEVGKTYEGILPIVVNNDVNRISAQHIPLGVQDPLYFVEDSETACVIGFSGEIVPEGVMTESALGFENNKITGYNGSAFSAGNEYEAGSYIDITNNTISVVNLPTSADVQNIVDVATSGLMPSGDYLTKESADTLYAPTGNYLTGLPEDLVYTADITGLATTAQLDEKLDKSDSGNFLLTSDSAKFYPMDSNPSGYITAHQSLAGYATEQWVENKGYITGVDIPESATWNATTQTVSANSAQWAGGTANPQIPVTGINGIKISESGDKVVFEVSANYATHDDLTAKQDSLTFGYKDTAISSIDESAIYDNSAHARINTLAGRISDLSSNKLDTTAFSDVSGTFLTAHQDLSDYQTTAGMTAYQEAGDYYSASNPSGFITGVDLTPYQLTADMTAYQPAGDYLTTGDSANFYTTANESGFISEVPDTYLQNTDLATADGKVTAISGIPLSAGGDVPEGVMVESGLEFNAVNEISAYNGSAIAQYGAEKQWLVHDDTLVHASNSAQYALGVNVSALQRLMGIDETVLYSGNRTQSAVLSDSIWNYNRIGIYAGANGQNISNYQIFDTVDISRNGNTIMLQNTFNFEGTAYYSFVANYSVLDNGTTLYSVGADGIAVDTAVTTFKDNKNLGCIKKVIGIGRQA